MTSAGQPRPTAPQRVVRHGRVSWLTHPPHGEARISVESRAFGATPVALAPGAPIGHEATPGELLAVTHATLMAAVVSEVLEKAGSPADELVVTADCTFEGPVSERTLAAVDLHVHGRVRGLAADGFDDVVAVAHRRYLRRYGLRTDVPGQLAAVLERAGRRT